MRREHLPTVKLPVGNMIFAGLTKNVLEEMKFWIGVEGFNRKLASAQVQEFAEEFDREMCRTVRRRTA